MNALNRLSQAKDKNLSQLVVCSKRGGDIMIRENSHGKLAGVYPRLNIFYAKIAKQTRNRPPLDS